jgi:hypothetical protein
MALAFVAAMQIALAGCAVEWKRDHPLYCGMQEKTWIRDTLYFGLSIPGGGQVTDADWKRFETDVIGGAFPQGFTVIDAHGAWRGANGETAAEATRIVIVTHADDATAESAVRNIADRYRTMYKQEAVMRERDAVCVSL